MKRLPYIDEHRIRVHEDSAATWSALLRSVCRDPGDPTTVRWPYFSLEEATPPLQLALKGRHLFAEYKLVFELAEDGPGRTLVTARTWAAFPGVSGTVYRALVIGTGGHRVAVRRMLKGIAAQANQQGTASSR